MIFSLRVDGLDDIGEKYEELLESVIDSKTPEKAANQFADLLEAATPVGFTGKLKKSVLVEQIDDSSFAAGYSSGVERPGNPKLDSVLQVSKTGRSVLWASQDELEDIFSDVLGSFRGDSVMLAGYREEVG